MRTQTQESQKNMTAQKALHLLRQGNLRFVHNLRANRDLQTQVRETADGQYPFAAILGCIDSRASAELVFDQGLGDIFSIRVAGNCVNEDILGSMEFACKAAGSKLVLVLGHTRCGAIKGACDCVEMGNLSLLLKKFRPAVDHAECPEGDRSSNNEAFVNRVARLNVELTIKEIEDKSEILRDMRKNEEIEIVGGMYDVQTGEIEFYGQDRINQAELDPSAVV